MGNRVRATRSRCGTPHRGQEEAARDRARRDETGAAFQRELEHLWERLLAGDPAVVPPTLEEASRGNLAPAALVVVNRPRDGSGLTKGSQGPQEIGRTAVVVGVSEAVSWRGEKEKRR